MLLYGIACHLLFLAVYAVLCLFVGNLWLPRTIASPASSVPAVAVVIDLALIALFGLQHSVMARPAFKRLWTRVVPPPIERSTYVLASCGMTILLMALWQPIAIDVWNVAAPGLRALLWTGFAAGWLMVPAVSLLINHFDLFGTRQVWLHFRGVPYSPLPFRTPLLYRAVRHPLYVGWMIAFWATPHMTAGQLLFAVGMTAYMLGAAVLEERDLTAHFGEAYRRYQRQAPMFVPRLARVRTSAPSAPPRASEACEPALERVR
ncbi:MAG: hypothetical protein KF774_09540 [Planctomyces sp.]|nr:hypothetical protein [Planctomyces sp.]